MCGRVHSRRRCAHSARWRRSPTVCHGVYTVCEVRADRFLQQIEMWRAAAGGLGVRPGAGSWTKDAPPRMAARLKRPTICDESTGTGREALKLKADVAASRVRLKRRHVGPVDRGGWSSLQCRGSWRHRGSSFTGLSPTRPGPRRRPCRSCRSRGDCGHSTTTRGDCGHLTTIRGDWGHLTTIRGD